MMYLKKIILESIGHEKGNQFQREIVEYIKGFGKKGKLPGYEGPLNKYYLPYLNQAFEWAKEKVNDIRLNGKAWFEHEFRVNIAQNFKRNKRGLIYVERNIEFDIAADFSKLEFSSIGECWSWRSGNGRSYCSNFGITDNTVDVKICGYVHPDSVDWLETVYLNSYDMKNETEIRMNDNALVEVAYIKLYGDKIPMGGSYLINASSDKYRKKNW